MSRPKSKMRGYVEVADDSVVSEWRCPDCGKTARVHPCEFGEDFGTPMCPDCNLCMEYVRVLAKLPKKEG